MCGVRKVPGRGAGFHSHFEFHGSQWGVLAIVAESMAKGLFWGRGSGVGPHGLAALERARFASREVEAMRAVPYTT